VIPEGVCVAHVAPQGDLRLPSMTARPRCGPPSVSWRMGVVMSVTPALMSCRHHVLKGVPCGILVPVLAGDAKPARVRFAVRRERRWQPGTRTTTGSMRGE
jgi:hypothetical protein